MKKLRRRTSQLRVGDLVEVVEPVFVHRVGYPKQVKDYAVPDIERELGALERAVGVVEAPAWALRRFERQVRQQLQWLLAHADGFGGRARTLHTETLPQYRGATAYVTGLRTAMTGTYYPPTGGSNTWYSYSDPEPAGLEKVRAHRLAQLEWKQLPPAAPEDVNPWHDQRVLWCPELETGCVKLLEPAQSTSPTR